MYTFDTTGDGCDILYGYELIAVVPDAETAEKLCNELNKLLTFARTKNGHPYRRYSLAEGNYSDWLVVDDFLVGSDYPVVNSHETKDAALTEVKQRNADYRKSLGESD